VQEIAENNYVYRNVIHHAASARTHILQDVASNPTLPRTKTVRCALCNHGEAVFFQVGLLYHTSSFFALLIEELKDIPCYSNVNWHRPIF
jgi:hypothetical protein